MKPALPKHDLALAEALLGPLRLASRAIMAVRARVFTVETKADSSPVTEADREAEEILLAALNALAPHIPIVAEEEVALGRIPALTGGDYFLVDALDGTKEFLRGGDDFTVNVGLIRDGIPVLGLVSAPARDRAWFGVKGCGAFALSMSAPEDRRPILVRAPPGDGIDILASRSHRDPASNAFIARFPKARVAAVGSSVKFCLLAEGKADLYVRLAPTSQWDIAAGDAILRAAGGRTLDLGGSLFHYAPGPGAGAEAFLNPSFVATAGIDPFPAG